MFLLLPWRNRMNSNDCSVNRLQDGWVRFLKTQSQGTTHPSGAGDKILQGQQSQLLWEPGNLAAWQICKVFSFSQTTTSWKRNTQQVSSTLRFPHNIKWHRLWARLLKQTGWRRILPGTAGVLVARWANPSFATGLKTRPSVRVMISRRSSRKADKG